MPGFANKSSSSQSYGFPSSHVRIWELEHKEGWALKNWCFWIVLLEKTLASLLDTKGNHPEYSLKGLMLKLQCFGHVMERADSLEKTPMMGKIDGKRRRGWQKLRWLDSITNSVNINLSKLWEIMKDRRCWHSQFTVLQRVGQNLVIEQQQVKWNCRVIYLKN